MFRFWKIITREVKNSLLEDKFPIKTKKQTLRFIEFSAPYLKKIHEIYLKFCELSQKFFEEVINISFKFIKKIRPKVLYPEDLYEGRPLKPIKPRRDRDPTKIRWKPWELDHSYFLRHKPDVSDYNLRKAAKMRRRKKRRLKEKALKKKIK